MQLSLCSPATPNHFADQEKALSTPLWQLKWKCKKKRVGELTGTAWEFYQSPVSIRGSNISLPSLFPWILVLKIRRSCCLGSVPLKLMESQMTSLVWEEPAQSSFPEKWKAFAQSMSHSLQRIQGTRACLWKPHPDVHSATPPDWPCCWLPRH